MGIDQPIKISLTFNQSLTVQGSSERFTSHAGALLLREVDDQLGLTAWLADHVHDPRVPEMCSHSTTELLRTRLYFLALTLVWQDQSDRLREDGVIRLATSQKDRLDPLKGPAIASQPTLSRLTEWLTLEHNLQILRRALFEFTVRKFKTRRKTKLQEVTIDVDSFPIKAHGQQPGSANNGHYHMRCFHPLVAMISETADLVAAKLRPGNVHTADGVMDFLLPVIDRVEHELARVAYVRGDAGFPDAELLRTLEQRGIGYVFRIPNRAPLKRQAEPYLKRPVGRPPTQLREWCYECRYKAGEWKTERRVILVVMEKSGKEELDYFYLVTNFSSDGLGGEQALDWYRQRGTFEGHLGEFNLLRPHLSSSPRPKSNYRGRSPKTTYPSVDSEKANEVTFLLFTLAYNLLNGLRDSLNRRRQRGSTVSGWSLCRILTKVLLVAGKLSVSGGQIKVELNRSAAVLWEGAVRSLEKLRPQGIDSS